MLSDDARRLVRWNLLILLAGAGLAGLLNGLESGAGLGLFALQIAGQALFNLLLALAHSFGGHGASGTAGGYWLSLLLVLLIGPGTCGLLGALSFG